MELVVAEIADVEAVFVTVVKSAIPECAAVLAVLVTVPLCVVTLNKFNGPCGVVVINGGQRNSSHSSKLLLSEREALLENVPVMFAAGMAVRFAAEFAGIVPPEVRPATGIPVIFVPVMLAGVPPAPLRTTGAPAVPISTASAVATFAPSPDRVETATGGEAEIPGPPMLPARMMLAPVPRTRPTSKAMRILSSFRMLRSHPNQV